MIGPHALGHKVSICPKYGAHSSSRDVNLCDGCHLDPDLDGGAPACCEGDLRPRTQTTLSGLSFLAGLNAGIAGRPSRIDPGACPSNVLFLRRCQESDRRMDIALLHPSSKDQQEVVESQ